MVDVSHLLGVFVDDDNGLSVQHQVIDDGLADTAKPADDRVVSESVNHFVHSSPSHKLAQLALDHCLDTQCERIQHGRDAGGDNDHGEKLFTIRWLSAHFPIANGRDGNYRHVDGFHPAQPRDPVTDDTGDGD